MLENEVSATQANISAWQTHRSARADDDIGCQRCAKFVRRDGAHSSNITGTTGSHDALLPTKLCSPRHKSRVWLLARRQRT